MTHSKLASQMVELCTLLLGLQCIARALVYAESGYATDDVLYSCPCLLCTSELSDQNVRGFCYAVERCVHGWSAAGMVRSLSRNCSVLVG